MKLQLLFVLLILLISTALSGCSEKPGKFDSLAKCLTANGVKMYGTEWCPHCKSQKAMFGSSFKYVDYIDCDKNRNECVGAGVKGYPTWAINGTNYEGEQTLGKLASLSGC